jgi:hypothetical protein
VLLVAVHAAPSKVPLAVVVMHDSLFITTPVIG